MRFDAQPLRKVPGVGQLLGYTSQIVPLLLTAATAFVLIGGAAFWRDLKALVQVPVKRRRFGIGVTVHGMAFAAFLVITQELFGNVEALVEGRRLLMAGWVIAGVLAFVSLLSALAPFNRMWGVVWGNALAFCAAAVGGVLAWGAGHASESLWGPLSKPTLSVVVTLLEAVSEDVTYGFSPPRVKMGDFAVRIAPICSGFEGVGLIIVFMCLYFWFARHRLRFPGVLLLIPLAVVVIWLANTVRIAALIAVGAWWSPEIALGGFHSKAGWVFFCAIALAVTVVAHRFPLFSKDAKVAQDTWNPTAAYLVPLLVLLFVSMIGGLFVAEFNSAYPIQLFAAVVALALYRGYYQLRWSWSWPAAAIGVAIFLGLITLDRPADSEARVVWHEGFSALSPWAASLWIVSRAFGSVLIVPVVEELAFRGFLMRRLISRDFTDVSFTGVRWAPLLVSSIAFGLLHQHMLTGVLAGIGYGVGFTLRGRMSDAILAHVVANGLIAVYVLATGNWSLWM